MIDTIDSMMLQIKPLLKVEDHCYFEADVKPMGNKDVMEYSIYLIKGDEVFKIVLSELTVREMKEFVKGVNFNRYLHQRMDRLAVKAGYSLSLVNNDKIEKDFE